MSMTALDPTAGGSAGRATRGQVPFYTPRLNGVASDFTAIEASLTLSEGQHDSYNISCISSTLENTEGFIDSPISFYFGAPPRTELFSGYVMNVTDEQKAQGQLSFALTILGATKVTYQGKPRFWRRKAVTSAISDLASNSGLGYWGHEHTHLWDALAQTNESDWSMMRALASKIGFVLFNRYGVVLCYDPIQRFREGGTYTQIVSGLDSPGSSDRTLLDFEQTTLSSIAQDNMGQTYGYFTTSDAPQISKQAGDFTGYVFDTRTTVRDQVEAAVYEKAADVTANRWGESAVARIWGDADIFPGMCVNVVTSAKRWYAPKTDGRWLVNGVGHSADRQQYQTILFLSRPDQSVVANTPIQTDQTYVPFWQDPNPARARPSLTVHEGLWTSSWANQSLRGML